MTAITQRVPAPVAPAPAVTCTITGNPLGLEPAALYGVARRYNIRRSALFVSRVLGKHVPASPATVALAGELLAARVAGRDLDPTDGLDGDPAVTLARLRADRSRPLDGAVVLAFAETATALGHLVRDGLAAPILVHTTRVPLDRPPLLSVEEEHSHATTHRVHHRDPAALAGPGPVVLVDDELTTGRTALTTIAALHATHPRDRYVVAALLDWRDEAARAGFAATAARLGTRIDVVALVTGSIEGAILDGAPPPEPAAEPAPAAAAPVRAIALELPVPATARLGWGPAEQELLESALPVAADRVAAGLGAGPVLCVGTEELMYVPLRLAEQLAAIGPDRPVRFQSTTRSPIVVADRDGYPIRQGLRFAHHDEPERLSRLYNVAPGGYGDVVVFVEGAPDPSRTASMVAALAGTGARVHLAALTGRSR